MINNVKYWTMNLEWKFNLFVLNIIIGDTSGLYIYLLTTMIWTSNVQIVIGV